eukprot:XP_002519338.2 protein CHUP1, chloroplastic [Ricinus communis]
MINYRRPTKTERSIMSQPTTPSRFRLNSKAPKPEPPAKKERAQSVPPDFKKDTKLRRSVLVNTKPKSRDELLGSQMEVARVVSPSLSVNRPVHEQFSKPRTQRSARKIEEDTKKELLERIELNDNLIQDLKSQVLSLKAELDKAQSLNEELESQNKKLQQDLASAEAKVAAALNNTPLPESIGGYQSPKFKDIQKLIANKLENSTVKKDAMNGPTSVKTPSPPPPSRPIHLLSKAETKAPSCPSLPPPPPPPPPLRPLARAATAPKTPAIVEFYQSLRKHGEKRHVQGHENQYKPVVTSAHSSVVGEIQNRSAHLLAIKSDIETKGDFINGLIKKVLAVAYTDIEDVLKFVDWLDGELSTLADERAVLKHFNWPERKADAIREAAIEYRSLKQLENEISSFKDDPSIPCGSALKKMAILLDKSERGIGRLVKLRNSVLRSYQEWKIPSNWMLDSGMMSKIKQASMKLAKMYMRRVIEELEVGRNTDRESNQEALVLQGVNFAYRAHQFAGSLDSETMCAIEEIRQRVPGHQGGGSRELLAAIASCR